MKTYSAIAAAVFNEPWVILPAKFEAIVAVLELRLAGGQVSEDEIRAVTGAAEMPKVEPGTKVAVLPLFGVIQQHASLMQKTSGGTSTEEFGQLFAKAANDPGIGSIVMVVNSPGGSVFGTQELGDLIFAAREKKPIIAAVSSEAASGGYWLASQAHQIVLTPGGHVGSIGVITAHRDISKAQDQEGVKTTLFATPEKKAQFHPFGPLSEDDVGAIRERQAATYERFVGAVARGRGVKAGEVKANYGGGGMLTAREALAAGMVDRIATYQEVLAEQIAKGRDKPSPSSARAHAAQRLAEAD